MHFSRYYSGDIVNSQKLSTFKPRFPGHYFINDKLKDFDGSFAYWFKELLNVDRHFPAERLRLIRLCYVAGAITIPTAESLERARGPRVPGRPRKLAGQPRRFFVADP